jgi:hypothetical protein
LAPDPPAGGLRDLRGRVAEGGAAGLRRYCARNPPRVVQHTRGVSCGSVQVAIFDVKRRCRFLELRHRTVKPFEQRRTTRLRPADVVREFAAVRAPVEEPSTASKAGVGCAVGRPMTRVRRVAPLLLSDRACRTPP